MITNFSYSYNNDDYIFKISKKEGKNLLNKRNYILKFKNTKNIQSINIKGKDTFVNYVTYINEEIREIIYDLEIDTRLKDKLDNILFSNLDIKKKRIKIRKLKRSGLDKKYIKMFIYLLEYIQKI